MYVELMAVTMHNVCAAMEAVNDAERCNAQRTAVGENACGLLTYAAEAAKETDERKAD